MGHAAEELLLTAAQKGNLKITAQQREVGGPVVLTLHARSICGGPYFLVHEITIAEPEPVAATIHAIP